MVDKFSEVTGPSVIVEVGFKVLIVLSLSDVETVDLLDDRKVDTVVDCEFGLVVVLRLVKMDDCEVASVIKVEGTVKVPEVELTLLVDVDVGIAMGFSGDLA